MQIDPGEKEWVDFAFCLFRFTQRRRKDGKLRKVPEKQKFNAETFEHDPFAGCRQNSNVRRQASNQHGCFGSQRVSRPRWLLEMVIIYNGQIVVTGSSLKTRLITRARLKGLEPVGLFKALAENLKASEEKGSIKKTLNFYRV